MYLQREAAQGGPEEGRGIARGHSVLHNGTVLSRAKDCFQLVRVRGRERERARRQDARGARRTLRPSRLELNLGSLLSMALDLALPSLSHPSNLPNTTAQAGEAAKKLLASPAVTPPPKGRYEFSLLRGGITYVRDCT